jgi:hypothetical protein
VVAAIVDGANVWLASVPLRYRHHTFTLMVYDNGRPRVYVMSTFQHAGGGFFTEPSPTLQVSSFKPRMPRALVTGWGPAVSAAQRLSLVDALGRNLSPELLRHQVAIVSRDAATRAQETVSEACVVAHLLPDGSGEAQVFGILGSKFTPTLIAHGEDVTGALPAVAREADSSGPLRLVGATWTANVGLSAVVCAYREVAAEMGNGWPDMPATTEAYGT